MKTRFECPHCRQPFAADPDRAGVEFRCPHCDRLVNVHAIEPVAVEAPTLPQEPAPPAEQAAVAAPAPSQAPRTSGMAVASLVLGVFGLIGGWVCCGGFFSLLAVIFGHIAHAQIARRPQELSGRGLAIAGFVTGYAGLLLAVVFAVFFGTLNAFSSAASSHMK